jgi:hypothetical protein
VSIPEEGRHPVVPSDHDLYTRVSERCSGTDGRGRLEDEYDAVERVRVFQLESHADGSVPDENENWRTIVETGLL